MREGRPVAGRKPRSLLGRAFGLQPKYQGPSGHSVINEDSGTPAVGDEPPDGALTDNTGLIYLMDNDGITYLTTS